MLGKLVRFGEAYGDFRHGRGHEPQLLGAPNEEREEPKHDDRHENGRGRGKNCARRAARIGDHAKSKESADEEPCDGGGEGDQERSPCGPLLQSENQAADGRNIVIGRSRQTALRGRTRRAARAGEVLGRRRRAGGFRRLGGAGFVLRRLQRQHLALRFWLRLGLNLGLLALLRRLAVWLVALVLLGLEPVCEGGTPGQRGRVVDLVFGRAPHHRLEGALGRVLVGVLIVGRFLLGGRLRLFLRHNAFLAPLDTLEQENCMPFEPKSATRGTSRRERTASHPVYFNRKVPNAFSPSCQHR